MSSFRDKFSEACKLLKLKYELPANKLAKIEIKELVEDLDVSEIAEEDSEDDLGAVGGLVTEKLSEKTASETGTKQTDTIESESEVNKTISISSSESTGVQQLVDQGQTKTVEQQKGVQRSESNQSENGSTIDLENPSTTENTPPATENTPPAIENQTIQQQSVTPINQEGIDEQRVLEQPITMVMTKQEFVRLAAPLLGYKYDGDPKKLESFLADVELVKDLAGEELPDYCFTFIKSRLEGKALESLPTRAKSVQEVVDALRAEIKCESSTVIEGKIMALRVHKGDFTKFAKVTEKLAESLRRSLVLEGISKEKAKEMSIKKTVELCRKTARSEVVKSVIASSSFSNPAEVVTKLITEIDIEKREKNQAQVQRKFQSENNGNFKGKMFNNNQQRGGKPFNKFNKFNKFDGKGKKFFNNQNQNGNRTFYNSNKRKFNNEATIRVVQGEPQPSTSQQIPQQQQFTSGEQFFRIAPN